MPELIPTLVALAGLPASGKSTLAQPLASALDAVVLDKDRIRESLFRQHVDYSREQNDLCVQIAFDVAGYLLARQPSRAVILDGRTYSRRYQMDALRHAAQQMGARLCLIECVCSPETARARLSGDKHHVAKDRDFDLYRASRAQAEAIDEPRLVLDTDAITLDECVAQALQWIRSGETES